MELRVPKPHKEFYERLDPDVRVWVDAMMVLTNHLLERIQDLEARLAKNSLNNSKPPSSDGLAKLNRKENLVDVNLGGNRVAMVYQWRELTFIFEAYSEKWARRMHELLLKIHRLVATQKENGKTARSADLIGKCETKYEKIYLAATSYHSRLEPLEFKNDLAGLNWSR